MVDGKDIFCICLLVWRNFTIGISCLFRTCLLLWRGLALDMEIGWWHGGCGEVVFGIGFEGELVEIVLDFLVGYLGIDLRRADVGVAHHLADCLYRHAVGEADLGGEGVTRHVERQVAIQMALLLYQMEAPL